MEKKRIWNRNRLPRLFRKLQKLFILLSDFTLPFKQAVGISPSIIAEKLIFEMFVSLLKSEIDLAV